MVGPSPRIKLTIELAPKGSRATTILLSGSLAKMGVGYSAKKVLHRAMMGIRQRIETSAQQLEVASDSAQGTAPSLPDQLREEAPFEVARHARGL